MGNYDFETGWQRFLDRLKQLWGKRRDGVLARMMLRDTRYMRTQVGAHDQPAE